MRFDVTLWDVHGYRMIRTLRNAHNLNRQNEILGENIFEFSMPIKDPNFSYLKHRSIIRLVDNSLKRVETTVSAISTTNKTVTVADSTGISIGDFIQVFEIGLSGKTDTTTAIVPKASATFDVTTPANLNVDNFYYIEGESSTGVKNSEAFQVISKAGSTITADIGFAYKIGAVITEPGRSFIGKVTLKNGNLLTLSRVDISSSSGAIVRKVNFETFRIKEITETRENGIPIARVRCEHLMYDLNDTQFFKDARTDIAYNSKGPNQTIEDEVDISTFVDNILERHAPINNTPLKLSSFIKGDIYRFRYSLGTCSTAGTTTITGDTEANWNAADDDVFFSGGSSIAIEGESGLLTIGRKSTNTVITTTAASSTAYGKKYLIISKGAHSGVAKVGTCQITQGNKTVSGFSFTVNDGSIQYGARLQIAGDAKIYIVDYVTLTSVVLTEAIERATPSPPVTVNCVIKEDERPINISSTVTLLGALKTMCEAFTDDRQQVWYEIGEDRSLNVLMKPKPDERDPTSDLVVRYTNAINKNLRSIQRQFNPTPFGNRIIPLGASSDWINAESDITTSVVSNAQNGKERYIITSGDNEKFRLGDPIQIFRDKVTGTVNSSTQVTLTVSPSPSWNIDRFVGGLVLITSGDGKGQMRRVISNTADTLTIGRRWDILPTGSTFTVASDIGNAFIRGWGYYKDVIKSATGTTFQINGYAPTDHVYRGGLVTVLSGTGEGQVKVIIDNIASGGNTQFTVANTDQFSPTLVPDNSIVEIFALSQVVEEKRSGATFIDGGAGSRYVQYTPDRAASVDMWNNGKLHITSGANTARYTITDTTLSGSDVRIHVDTWTSGLPSAGDGILAILPHFLVMNINPGLEFTASDGDTIALLLKEHGGPLTVGKYHLYRSTVDGAFKITQTSFTVQSGHGSRFAKNQIVFIGAKSITSSVIFDLNRGNQIQGQTATIASVSGDVLTFNETLNPTPQPYDHVEIIALVDPNSIVTHGIIEIPFTQSDINDPQTLYTMGNNELKRIKDISPKYEIGFFHLYELDPTKYPYDNYELGDTIRVIDDEMGIDQSNIQILKESYNPNTPADLSNTIEAGAQPRQYIRDQSVKQAKKQQEQGQKLEKLQRGWDTPKCSFWSDAQKKCVRIVPPNRFCDSDESFHDGRRTREGYQITHLQCQGYMPTTEDSLNKAREIITELVEVNVTGITNSSFDTYPTTTNSATVDVDFRVIRAVPIVVNVNALVTLSISGSTSTDGAHTHGGSVPSDGSHSHTFSDTDAIQLGLDTDSVAVQILKTLNNEIAPYNTGSTVIGLIKGCRVQYRNTVTATYSTVDARIIVLCIGQKE